MKNVIVTAAAVDNELEVSIEKKDWQYRLYQSTYIPLGPGHDSVGDVVITESLIRIPNK